MKIATSAAEFEPAYIAAQPAAVQAALKLPLGGPREAKMTELAQDGYLIDAPIMIWGWGSWWTTNERLADHYTWIPSALQPPIALAPGLIQGGVPRYEPGIVPFGGIIVTLDLDLLPYIFTPLPGSVASLSATAPAVKAAA